ncbi:MAG: hypothetical protein US04_C0002G0009 [Candidatus Nomurabacteria bacterium GW2011_GWD2_36_14]|nr:MAG: hypothetical protein US00_C0004G0009 [Candidatus Nomurabacteria bacterium GW2011_GWF2_36_126]KKP96337.1 MAG: hypothetical protein US04_C0002G0009 [Candidatus Nomurabacteria bacterium GW2011_GWD2_36_14]KKP98998.1 MAG: hypothetical protein US08_C0004G0009 [Candidatus Nomurabacteria bacterium GW2011_GWF2_36_19]KKQ05164.1 MAG: hypothetical protein US17_C0006G0011 [Candidatus Nomurabacteria bacterium GW2011_GWF1_36_47]KKQ09149.1 MAG: hypothetical protein US21_C0007G0008 [Candidatus Nomurabac
MTIILAVGWPVLVIGSIYLFIKGRHVYALVKGSLVGKVVRILVYTMMVEMYSLGIVSTGFMYCSPKGVAVVIPVFIIWFVMFVVTIKVLMNAEREARALTGGK